MTLVTASGSAIALLMAIILAAAVRGPAWTGVAACLALLAGWTGGYACGWYAFRNEPVTEEFVMLLFGTAFWAGLAGSLFGTSIGLRLRRLA